MTIIFELLVLLLHLVKPICRLAGVKVVEDLNYEAYRMVGRCEIHFKDAAAHHYGAVSLRFFRSTDGSSPRLDAPLGESRLKGRGYTTVAVIPVSQYSVTNMEEDAHIVICTFRDPRSWKYAKKLVYFDAVNPVTREAFRKWLRAHFAAFVEKPGFRGLVDLAARVASWLRKALKPPKR